MSNNTTDIEGDHHVTFTCYSTWGVPIASVNGMSLVINILHLVVITSMRSLKNCPLKLIFIHMSLAQIGCALGITAAYSCLPSLSIIRKLTSGFAIVAIVIEWPLFTARWIFVIASIERYYRVCKPHSYGRSMFVRRLQPVLAMAWILSFTWMIAGKGALALIRNKSLSSLKILRVGRIICQYLPMLIAGAMFSIVLRKLTRLPWRKASNHQNETGRFSVYFIMVYFIFNIITLFDVVPSLILIFDPHLFTFRGERLRNAVLPLYGIINIVIYATNTNGYVQRVREIFFMQNKPSEEC